MLIIGHRGAKGLEAENTIRSFQKAQELGVDMIETDLRLQNGEIVLNHDPLKNGAKYPTLNELLAIARVPLNLEIKEAGFEEQVLRSIKGFTYKVLITSWNPRVLKKIRTLDGNIAIGPVVGYKYCFFLPIVVMLLKNLNIYSITIGPELVNSKRMKRFKKLGWKVFPFTVNNPVQFEELQKLGVDGVFTDFPNIIKNYD